MRTIVSIPICVLLLWVPITSARAQGASASTGTATKVPTYDVATIRPDKSGSGNSSMWSHDAYFTVQNVGLRNLIQSAFEVRREQIFGLPAWAESTTFDINAKVADPDMTQIKKLTPQQLRFMQQTLLEDRFGLKWHYEMKVLPVYELVVAKNGSKLKSATAVPAKSRTSMNDTNFIAAATPVSMLVDMLSNEVGRPVVDKTGLNGKYDFHLKWSREQDANGRDSGSEADAPLIFTALVEQLGLKLQPAKDPVRVMVVDQIHGPSEN